MIADWTMRKEWGVWLLCKDGVAILQGREEQIRAVLTKLLRPVVKVPVLAIVVVRKI